MRATSISEVLGHLDDIIAWSRDHHSRLGYFAALYRDVTARVASAIDGGQFQDPSRMERLDAAFANRYLEAIDKWGDERGPTRSWASTFSAAQRWRPLVIQHLLLGMNAHINLDLGIAAAEIAPGDQIDGLKRDFLEIDRILGEMIDAVQRRLATVSPWSRKLDRLGGRSDEVISNFCLRHARDDAWELARRLAPLAPSQRAPLIAARDRTTADRVARILRPGGPWLLPVLVGIRLGEEEHVPSVIDALSTTYSGR